MFRKTVARMMRRWAFDPVTARGRQWAAGSLLSLGELRRGDRYEMEAIIRSLAGGSYLGNATAVCRILGRYKLLVDTDDLGVGIHLMTEGFWEFWLTELILKTVEPGMCVIDVGANLGYFSVLTADWSDRRVGSMLSSRTRRSPIDCARASP